MKLAGLRLHRYELPLAEPLTLKGAKLAHREGILVEAVGDGDIAGWGEASPLPGFSRESLDEVVGQLRGPASHLVGREVADDWTDPDGELARELDVMGLAPSARFGLELALWNLCAAWQRTSLPEIISPHPRASVPVNALVSGPPERALEGAREARDDGYGAVKLKVGAREVDEDVETVRAVSDALGDAVALRLDTNRAWSLEEAARFARATAGVVFEYVEEPLSDPAGLPYLAEDLGLPVALDESLVGMEPEALGGHGYARAFVLKPTLIGGISRTLRFARGASRLGARPVLSAAYETGVGTSVLVALAAGVGDEEVPAGLDTYRQLERDVLSPRLNLPSPRVDVRTMFGERREVERRLLHPVG